MTQMLVLMVITNEEYSYGNHVEEEEKVLIEKRKTTIEPEFMRQLFGFCLKYQVPCCHRILQKKSSQRPYKDAI